MAFYVVNYHYRNDPRLEEVRPRHREFLATLVERGVLRASGPLVGVASPAAVLICEADDAAAVENALADDPFRAEDLLDRADITEWNPVLGVFAS
ncbi:YciI family protein [Mobilicoccus sp.]|uniref:YciI family protein n=1 Tax=Mobilicoccus sp. TaxID=2034349 RepID=UPI0028AB9EC0|nr:YciI family protein [Mobilicoccus sp.]